MSICQEISNYYRDIFAPMQTTTSGMKIISPLSRLNFNTGAGLAIIFLVQKIALSIFFLTLVLLTCGLKQTFRASLLQNVREGLVYVGAISLGFLGVFFPQTINQRILHIPSSGLKIPFAPSLSP